MNKGVFGVTRKVNTPSHAYKTLTSTVGLASATFTQITALNPSIKLTHKDNHVRLAGHVTVGFNAATTTEFAFFKLKRNDVDIMVGDAAANRTRCSFVVAPITNNSLITAGFEFIDDPHSNDVLNYTLWWACAYGSQLYLNRTFADTNSALFARATSTFNAQEVPH